MQYAKTGNITNMPSATHWIQRIKYSALRYLAMPFSKDDLHLLDVSVGL